MDFNTLTAPKSSAGSLADWINSSTIAPEAPFFVEEAQSWIYRRLRHWRMLSQPTTGTLVIGQDSIPYPPDMLEPFQFVLTGQNSSELRQKTVQEIVIAWAFDGNNNRIQQQPVIYSFNGTNIIFDSPPDSAYPYALIYYQQPPPLSADNPSNFLTNFYQRLMRAVLMMQACEWTKEANQGQYDRTYWAQQAGDELAVAQMESDRARRASIDAGVLIGAGESPLFGL
jgi:hypothetical protein